MGYKILLNLLHLVFIIIRKAKKEIKNKQNGILILSLNNIGDSIFTFSAISSIINFRKNNVVIVLSYTQNVKIFNLLFNQDIIKSVDKNWFYFKGRIANRKARNIVRKINPEIIIDLTGNLASASLIIFSSAKEVYGTNKEYLKHIYSSYLPKRTIPHLVDLYLDISKLYTGNVEKPIYFPLIKNNSNYKILIHPFAGWKEKCWPLNNYIFLAQKLNKYDTYIIFEKRSLNKDIVSYLKENKINFMELNSIDNLVEEISKTDLIIGNDSGPIYIANVLGKYTFTIYGPTNPSFSIPSGRHNRYLYEQLKCTPVKDQYCFNDGGRNCPHPICMNFMSRDKVYNEIEKFIQEKIS